MRKYYEQSIKLIGIVFMIFTYDFFNRDYWWWLIMMLISIMFYCVAPLFFIPKSADKTERKE